MSLFYVKRHSFIYQRFVHIKKSLRGDPLSQSKYFNILKYIYVFIIGSLISFQFFFSFIFYSLLHSFFFSSVFQNIFGLHFFLIIKLFPFEYFISNFNSMINDGIWPKIIRLLNERLKIISNATKVRMTNLQIKNDRFNSKGRPNYQLKNRLLNIINKSLEIILLCKLIDH